MALKLITAPTSYPISLSEAKEHLRVAHNDENTLIEAMLKAATAHAEKFMGRALMEQTWDYYLDEFPADGKAIDLPMPPVISVTGLFYSPSDTEFTAFSLDAASDPARLYLPNGGSWPTPDDQANAVRVRFMAGYTGDSSPESANVPADIRAGILLILGTLYAQRETIVTGTIVTQVPWSAEQLLRPHRVHTAIA